MIAGLVHAMPGAAMLPVGLFSFEGFAWWRPAGPRVRRECPLPAPFAALLAMTEKATPVLRASIDDGSDGHATPVPGSARSEREKHLRYLVDCVLGGQHDKFEEIVGLCYNQIYAVAWRYSGHREDALDITQNVLVRLFRALSGWGGRCSFATWVHRITMNAAIDFHRRHQKHDQHRIDPEEANVGEEARVTSDPFMGITAENPRHVLARHEVRKAVVKALEQLSDMQRRCFVLRHFHDMTVAEVAEVAGCGEGSVKQHLFRASAHLRQLLAHLEPMLESDTLSPPEEP